MPSVYVRELIYHHRRDHAGVPPVWQLCGAEDLRHLLSHKMRDAQVTEQHLALAVGDQQCSSVCGEVSFPPRSHVRSSETEISAAPLKLRLLLTLILPHIQYFPSETVKACGPL